MKIYIAIIADRHSDIEAVPFVDREKAIEYARKTALDSCFREDDFEENQIDGWEFHATYSSEGDYVQVTEHEIEI